MKREPETVRLKESIMPVTRHLRKVGVWIVAFSATLTALAESSSGSEVVILKDGFVIQGTVRKEYTSINDPATGKTFPIPKANGFDIVDEGPRVWIFSTHARQLAAVSKDVKLRPEYKSYTMPFPGRKSNEPLPAAMSPRKLPEYNDKWFRTIEVDLPGGFFEKIEQQITYIDPYFVYIVSPTHYWRQCFRTSEMDPSWIRKRLSTHPELAPVNGKLDASKRVALARFMLDAGWLKLAKDDVAQLQKDYPGGVPPDVKENYDKLLKDIDQATAELVIKEGELALGAGRYRYAHEVLSAFPEKLADPDQLSRMSVLLAQLKSTEEQYAAARRLLAALIDEVTGLGRATPLAAVAGGTGVAIWPVNPASGLEGILASAGQTILTELHPDAVHRLEFFINLAAQVEKEKLQGKQASKKPIELLATAASGWAKGKNGATPNPELAIRIWQARELVLSYQQANDLNTRNRILTRYKSTNQVPIDELSQIISLLPPAEPEDLLFRTGTVIEGKDVLLHIYKRNTASTTTHPRGIPYLVKLPPEYHHGRAYPVIIVLPHPGMQPEHVIASLAKDADRNGYILLAPEWSNEFGKGWSWRGQDHVYVTQVLRDAIRHFCVDNDRVFLFGALDGANMAMDIGMSHPDLFAGVLAMSPIPKWQNMFSEYWRNAQKLPFYVVTGEMSGDSAANMRLIFERWMPNGFPGLMVIYKGRGIEWFPAEIPSMFDWLSRKKRVNGTATLQLGNGPRFPWMTMRQSDNRFYWLGVDKVLERHTLEELPPGKQIVPAEIQGDIRGSNLIALRTRGISQVSIWLSQELIDWTKPVRVQLNGAVPPGYKPTVLEPSLEVLLEDYRQRGDRRMLFMGRLQFTTSP
jgi:hypothetical protein